ncbi:hypothetical protein D3C76_749540 [compost metagenome]
MNEQLQQALTAILNKTMSGVDAGVNFLSAEIPDVIHQLLLWKMVSSGIGFLLITACVVIFTILAVRGIRVLTQHSAASNLYVRNTGEIEKQARETMDALSHKIPLAVISIGASLLSWIVFLAGGLPLGLQMLKIWIAPKIYLIEYAASLAK